MHFPSYCIDDYKLGRDKYVHILWQNIMPGKEKYYQIMPKELFSELYGMGYDYHSV